MKLSSGKVNFPVLSSQWQKGGDNDAINMVDELIKLRRTILFLLSQTLMKKSRSG